MIPPVQSKYTALHTRNKSNRAKTKCVKIFFVTVRSIINKVNEVKYYVHEYTSGQVLITGVWNSWTREDIRYAYSKVDGNDKNWNYMKHKRGEWLIYTRDELGVVQEVNLTNTQKTDTTQFHC